MHGRRGRAARVIGHRRQAHRKRAAAVGTFARGLDTAAVSLGDVLRDGQAQTAATVGARARLVRAVETLEHVRQISW